MNSIGLKNILVGVAVSIAVIAIGLVMVRTGNFDAPSFIVGMGIGVLAWILAAAPFAGKGAGNHNE